MAPSSSSACNLLTPLWSVISRPLRIPFVTFDGAAFYPGASVAGIGRPRATNSSLSVCLACCLQIL